MKKLIQFYFRTFSPIAPKLTGKQAFNLFQRTQKKSIREKEKIFYNLSKHFTVGHSLGKIDAYEMGNPNDPLVLLIHGWDSNAGSMAAIAIELAEKGNHVVAFNLPAHGFSKLKKANIVLCREYFEAVVNHIRSNKPFSVVSHSFGSAVTAFSLMESDMQVDKLVFLTNPNSFPAVFKDFSQFIQISKKGEQVILDEAEKLIGRPLNDYQMENVGEKINYNELLLVHDTYDRVLPYQNSVIVKNNWRDSQLLTIEKIGHYRMLWNEYVVNSVARFISAGKTIDISRTSNEKLAS